MKQVMYEIFFMVSLNVVLETCVVGKDLLTVVTLAKPGFYMDPQVNGGSVLLSSCGQTEVTIITANNIYGTWTLWRCQGASLLYEIVCGSTVNFYFCFNTCCAPNIERLCWTMQMYILINGKPRSADIRY